ncbi:MAG: NAD(P)/FAD-dependent oxidoreductase [Verrucomicrobiales bacterium]
MAILPVNGCLPDAYDVVIIGGALSGAAAAFLLLRQKPDLKVLIVEKNEIFSRRVGEATVEVSAYFLCRQLGLTSHLNDKHLAKQGLRFWFSPSLDTPLDHCSEIGGKYMARVPSYQVDRAVLDEEVLRRAVQKGAKLLRPAKVQQVRIEEGGWQEIDVQLPGGDLQTIRSRWVIDASGVAAMLARKNGWFEPNKEHPTTSVWARWRGVEEWDGFALAEKFPEWAQIVHGLRGTATNHFNGEGWWAWCIPLAGGDVSIGIVFDERIVRFPEGENLKLGQRLKAFLMEHGAAAEILKNAEPVEGDVHLRRNLPYSSRRIFGDGFALVGDAAGFIDPLYSPGMDWISYTVSGAVNLILAERNGEDVREKAQRSDQLLTGSYWKWFRAIYKDKYFYIGEYDLMRTGFLLDLGFYYAGVASQPFMRGKEAFLEPVFSTKPSIPFYHFISFYNRRLAKIGKRRRDQGRLSATNAKERFLFQGYTFNPWSYRWILYGILGLLKLELKEVRHYFQPTTQQSPARPILAPEQTPSK